MSAMPRNNDARLIQRKVIHELYLTMFDLWPGEHLAFDTCKKAVIRAVDNYLDTEAGKTDADDRVGRWLLDESGPWDGHGAYCSCCKEPPSYAPEKRVRLSRCPNCWARMDGGRDD